MQEKREKGTEMEDETSEQISEQNLFPVSGGLAKKKKVIQYARKFA